MKEKMQLFEEFEKHLLEDEKPSVYFNEVVKQDIFEKEYPFTLLGNLKNTPQSREHHPEGNVWNHTMLVVDGAAQRRQESENVRVFMWSALLHDLGKAPTTKINGKGRITSYDHDKVGQGLVAEFLKEFQVEQDFIKKVSVMVRWHMQVLFVVKSLPFAEIDKMLAEVSIEEIALLSLCDRLGRGEMTSKKEKEERENIKTFIKKCGGKK